MLSKPILVVTINFGMFLLLTGCVFSQSKSISKPDALSEDTPIASIHIRARSMEELVSKLSRSNNIPIGLEVALNDGIGDYVIDFESGSLKTLLDEFVRIHDNYKWEINDSVVNVYPRDHARDTSLAELLRTELRQVSVKRSTSCGEVEDLLVGSPEIQTLVNTRKMIYQPSTPNGFYIPQLGRDYTVDISNMPLRSILNTIVRDSPVAKSWFMQTDPHNRTFILRIYARQEVSSP